MKKNRQKEKYRGGCLILDEYSFCWSVIGIRICSKWLINTYWCESYGWD